MLEEKTQIESLIASLTLWEKLKLYDTEIERAKKQWFGFLRLALYKRILKRLTRFQRFIEQDLELKIGELNEARDFWQKDTQKTDLEKADLLGTIELSLNQITSLQRQFKDIVSPKTRTSLKQLEGFFARMDSVK